MQLQENRGKIFYKLKSNAAIKNLEVIINTINHGLIGIATFYITWYSVRVGFQEYQTHHAWFTTIGRVRS